MHNKLNQKILNIAEGVDILKSGGVIAYPTEAVFGLGCDPTDQNAIERILELKKRDANKGFIIIAASFEQLKKYVEDVPEENLQNILKTWPGPFTWIFPAKQTVSKLLIGSHNTVAVRVTNHPIAKQLCLNFGGAIVSTSANISKEQPARNVETLHQYFEDRLDGIVEGQLGGLTQPTEIRDAVTNKIIRPGGTHK